MSFIQSKVFIWSSFYIYSIFTHLNVIIVSFNHHNKFDTIVNRHQRNPNVILNYRIKPTKDRRILTHKSYSVDSVFCILLHSCNWLHKIHLYSSVLIWKNCIHLESRSLSFIIIYIYIKISFYVNWIVNIFDSKFIDGKILRIINKIYIVINLLWHKVICVH